jgi:hypothetical protein
MSVASEKPAGAIWAIRAVSNVNVAVIPVTAGSSSSSCATESISGSLSSCRSRL